MCKNSLSYTQSGNGLYIDYKGLKALKSDYRVLDEGKQIGCDFTNSMSTP